MDSTLEVLEAETRAVAEDYARRFGSGKALHGHCVEASIDLARRLHELGFEGDIADGHHRTPFVWPEGDTSPMTGHTWVEVDGQLLDPTRGQLDVDNADRIVLPLTDPAAAAYVRESAASFTEEFSDPVPITGT